MRRNFLLVSVLIMSMILTACGQKTEQPEKPAENEGVLSYEAQTIKEKPDIKDDFYTNLNYEYLTETKIPEGESSNGNFDDLARKTRESITGLINELNGRYDGLASGSDEKKVVDFYNMAADFDKRDELGLSPIESKLEEIRSAGSVKDIAAFIAENYDSGYGQFVRFVVDKDIKNENRNVLYIMEPQVGIEKTYYSGNDDFSKKIREAYLAYTEKLLGILGYDKDYAAKRAQEVYDFEKKIVEASLDREGQLNFDITYNPVSLKKLGKLTGNFLLSDTLERIGVKKTDTVIAEQPEVLKTINGLFADENLDVLKSFMELNILKKNTLALSRDVLEAEAEYIAVQEGVMPSESDEELAYAITDSTYGESLSKLYVERYFSSETKENVLHMAKEIIETYKRRLGEVDWISDSTRKQALKKLDTLDLKIGYPDTWNDYSSTSVKSYAEGGNLVEAIESMNRRNTKESIEKISKAPNRKEWVMQAHVVNAAYNPIGNDITFTAAILQAPFYSPERSETENLGGIGTVIGHEISHAFDNMGSKFDENGSFKNWWTEEDLKKLEEKADKAAAIYSALEVVDGHYVNGEISTGEIMADLGGMTVVLDIAKQRNLDTKKIFESYASVWREVSTKENMISTLIDEHPPAKFRVNNIVNLLDEFYEDFDVKEGDGMYVKPEDRLKVW